METVYRYNLPENLIAKKPAVPRDASRLLIYDVAKDEIRNDIFRNVARYLPADSVLMMNQSKVLPVRLICDGNLELLILLGESGGGVLKAIADRRLYAGDEVSFGNNYRLKVLDASFKVFEFEPNFSLEDLPEILREYGTTPIPKYIEGSPLTENEMREKYQTVFATVEGSAAAPTASLHFTPALLRAIPHEFVTLHVGLGTFAPVLPEHRESGKFYEETYEIPAATMQNIRGKSVVAVGTTVTRTLETYGKTGELAGKSDLFIRPPFEFKIVNSLITNFHLPGSSLMMLVEAFLQSKGSKRHLKDIYEFAMRENFRFYSFGDAMLIF